MTQFSVSDVAFEGFRITREKPAAVAVWVVAEIILLAVTAAIMASNPAFALLSDAMAHAQGDPQTLMLKMQDLAPRIMPTLGTVAPISLLIGIVLRTAVYRAVLRPSDGGLGYLKIGMDELRILALTIVTGLIIFAAILADGMLVGVLSLAGPAGGLLAFLGLLATLVLLAFLMLRLSLAGPQTFTERKLNLFGSLELTKPIFWPMFGSYFVAFILYMVVFILVSVIRNGLAAIMGGGGMQAMLGVGALALTKPLGILELLLEASVAGLGLAIVTGPTALVYQLVTKAGSVVDDVF